MKKILLVSLVFVSCIGAPSRKDYSCEEGFAQADCMYRNQKNPDKTICLPLVELYRDRMKEESRIKRLEYCRDKKPSDMSERECRSWMNEK